MRSARETFVEGKGAIEFDFDNLLEADKGNVLCVAVRRSSELLAAKPARTMKVAAA